MKKVILSIAITVVSFVAASCNKSYECDCAVYGGAGGTTYSSLTIKAANATEAQYMCTDKSTAPGSGASTTTDCALR